MGLGVVILLGLVLSGTLLVGTGLVCLVVWLLIRRRFPRAWPGLAAAPVLAALVPPALLASGLIWSNLAPPSARFQAVFAQAPTNAVRDLRGAGYGTSDAEEVYLAFRTDDAGLRRLLTPAFKAAQNDPRDLVPMPGDSAPPTWWTADRCAAREIWSAEGLGIWDDIVVTRCRSDGRIYVQARWVD